MVEELSCHSFVAHLVEGDSHDGQILERVQRLCDGRPVDVLFIDGDHSYDGVKGDWQTYGELVRPEGIVGFHDIADAAERKLVPVPRVWREIRNSQGAAICIRGCGIGAIINGAQASCRYDVFGSFAGTA